jgi:hypothetical protein
MEARMAKHVRKWRIRFAHLTPEGVLLSACRRLLVAVAYAAQAVLAAGLVGHMVLGIG